MKHHDDYQKNVDQFKFGNEADYEALYGGYPTFVPAVCFDRRRITGFEEPGPAYFSPYREETTAILAQLGETLTFIDLDIQPTVQAATGKLEVRIKGHAGVNEMPLQNSLRMTTWLVEDSIPTTTPRTAVHPEWRHPCRPERGGHLGRPHRHHQLRLRAQLYRRPRPVVESQAPARGVLRQQLGREQRPQPFCL